MQLPRRSTSPPRRWRPGFTLVELMIVIAIIGVVVTLAASAAMQAVTRQRSANTEATIHKVYAALKTHWQAVVHQAQTEPIRDALLYGDGRTMQGLIAMAGGDPANPDPDSLRRARVIWVKLRLKQQFPMNFLEALNPTPDTIRPSGARPFVVLPPDPVFVQTLPASAAANPPQSYEASVCLLLALSQARKGIATFNQDRLSSAELADAGAFNPSVQGLKLIVDSWGRPLTFYRWPIGGEVAASNPNRTARQVLGDPLDPDGLLLSARWNTPAAYAGRGGVWAFEKLLHPVHDLDLASYTPRSYYTLPVVASAGLAVGAKPPAQPYLSVYDLMGLPAPQDNPPAAGLPAALLHDPMKTAPGSTPLNWPNPAPESLDNIYSFRMRLGARGD